MSASRVAKAMKTKGLHYTFPRLPLTISLPGPLTGLKKIIIHGAVLPSATRFSINLKDANVGANNYFHFNPRFGDENVVVRNSRFNESWGTEERDGDNPFVPGESFLMTITAKGDGYKVKVNGVNFTVFQYRDDMPVENITHITLKGDVVCFALVITGSSLPVPLKVSIPSHVCIGDQIVICGDTPGGADRFAINLQCGADEDADIMYHFNPRFSNGEIVCNSRLVGEWANEVSAGLPIGAGQSFVYSMGVSTRGFHSYVNNSKAVDFDHRLDASTACVLHVAGEVEVKNVIINCPPAQLHPAMDTRIHELNESAISVAFCEAVPAILALNNNLQAGQMVVLNCYVVSDPTRFHLNLQCGAGGDDDVALHFNPRWDDDSGAVIVLNTKESGTWGSEERIENTMESGTYVTIIIYCKEEGFTVAIDGAIILPLFEHHMDFRNITHVYVDGCILTQRILAA